MAESSYEAVRLEGGPDYEHFERAEPGVTDGEPVVFRWTARTRVAE
jgi:hypothetical protein